jgi:hypothetical protein
MPRELLRPIESVLACIVPQHPLKTYDLTTEQVLTQLTEEYGVEKPVEVLEFAKINGLIEESSMNRFAYYGHYTNGNILVATEKGREAYNSMEIKKLLGDQI